MVVVIAEPKELELVKELGYDNYPIIITGVGAINVISALQDLPKETEILNIGYCGSNGIKVGKKVLVTTVSTLHEIANFNEKYLKCMEMLFWYTCDEIKWNTKAHCYTSTDFVTKTNIKEPCVFDMELAYICSMFEKVQSIKVVSDNLSYEKYKKNNQIKGNLVLF